MNIDLRAAEVEAMARMGEDNPVVQAPLAQVHHWLERALDLTRKKAAELGIDAGNLSSEPLRLDQSSVASMDRARLVSRANAYFDAVVSWQQRRPVEATDSREGDPTVPQDVIDHLALVVGAKIHRAVGGPGQGQPDLTTINWPGDADGSAKVAILSAERSLTAWTDLRDSGLASDAQIDASRAHLAWLIAELDRMFPRARAFVRPGFDE
jgi:hypothetical protein